MAPPSGLDSASSKASCGTDDGFVDARAVAPAPAAARSEGRRLAYVRILARFTCLLDWGTCGIDGDATFYWRARSSRLKACAIGGRGWFVITVVIPPLHVANMTALSV